MTQGASVVLTDTTIAENQVASLYYGQGGGYYSLSPSVLMTRCSIYANSLEVSAHIDMRMCVLASSFWGTDSGKSSVSTIAC